MQESLVDNDLNLDNLSISAINENDFICKKCKNAKFECLAKNVDKHSNGDINIFAKIDIIFDFMYKVVGRILN